MPYESGSNTNTVCVFKKKLGEGRYTPPHVILEDINCCELVSFTSKELWGSLTKNSNVDTHLSKNFGHYYIYKYIFIFHYVFFYALLSSSISTCLCYIYRVSCIYKGTSSQLKVCYENPRHSMMSSQIIASLMIDGPESLISVCLTTNLPNVTIISELDPSKHLWFPQPWVSYAKRAAKSPRKYWSRVPSNNMKRKMGNKQQKGLEKSSATSMKDSKGT